MARPFFGPENRAPTRFLPYILRDLWYLCARKDDVGAVTPQMYMPLEDLVNYVSGVNLNQPTTTGGDPNYLDLTLWRKPCGTDCGSKMAFYIKLNILRYLHIKYSFEKICFEPMF